MALLVGRVPGPVEVTSHDPGSGLPPAEQVSEEATGSRELSGGTLLAGSTFGDDGNLYMVDVMAPPGEAKVLRGDIGELAVDAAFTDETSAFASARFHPSNGRLYLTDVIGGGIASMTADGEDLRSRFSGEVDGVTMLPDYIAFHPDGTMFVADTRGMDGPGWATLGRIVRIDGDGNVLADHLPWPNGMVFDVEDAGLWVAQYNANRIDRFALDEGRTCAVAAHPAIHVNGGIGRVDSTAVDAECNLYQAFHNKAEIAVFAENGEQIGVVCAPAGGFVHTFEA